MNNLITTHGKKLIEINMEKLSYTWGKVKPPLKEDAMYG